MELRDFKSSTVEAAEGINATLQYRVYLGKQLPPIIEETIVWPGSGSNVIQMEHFYIFSV